VSGFRHLGDRTVHKGYIWQVVVAQFEDPHGDGFERDVVRSPGAVAAVPLRYRGDGTPYVTLVRQYRAPFDDVVVEVPAGMRDVADEPTEVTAMREMVEEVGLLPSRLEHLIDFYPSVGMTDSVLSLFLATEIEEVPREVHGPEETHMDVLEVDLDEAVQMIVDGHIHDAKTVIGLLLTERKLREAHGG
jgi:ADP-ribose pyrophosphatase